MVPMVRQLFEQGSVAVCGVDPGIRTTAVTSSTSYHYMLERVQGFCNEARSEYRQDAYVTWKLQAPTVNYSTHSDQHRIRRERARQKGKEGEVQGVRRIERERRTRGIRTTKTYQRLADLERRGFPEHLASESAVHFYGNWRPYNSTIKGHARRGTKQLRKEQRRKGLVAIVNEFNTSKTCHWCLKPLQLQKYRTNDGQVRRSTGSVCCVNPSCTTFINGCNTMNRDVNTSKNIALKGFSMVLSVDGNSLPVFSPQHPSTYQLDPSFARQPTSVRLVHGL